MDFASELDPEQYRAVNATEGAVLIIAGAGSGKTRVITYRIAKLISEGVPQESILALTFTNKAAREMADRARQIAGKPLKNLMISTFHSFGAWFLRKEIRRLGWKENFAIYDEQDRLQALKECAREMGTPMESFDAVGTAARVSAIKTGFGGNGGADGGDGEDARGILEEYRKALYVYNAVDFDDLIAMPLEIFRRFPETAANLRDRFRYIMIDEFQDTSLQQYEFVKAFSSGNICAVGDDDQSIYSWRGADFGNIRRFEADHPGAVEVKLERNYRSTPLILEAANALIAHNVERKKKKLWSPTGKGGVPIVVRQEDDDVAEAEDIVGTIRTMRLAEGFPWDSFGILVRANTQVRVIEESLMENGVPYRTAGGPSFYQRKEVRDMLAYLKTAANPDDDMSLMRVMNVPRRGIGKAGMEKIVSFARGRGYSIRTALETIRHSEDGLSAHKSVKEALDFMDLVGDLRERLLSRKKPISATLREFVSEIGYWRYLLEDNKTDEKAAAWKYRNIELLAQSIERWERDPDTLDSGLFAYLARVALVTKDDGEEDGGKVSLLTMHAAKGLEFDVVFIPGCEEGLLPHARSVEESGGNIEEERRLFYVALTRARKKLVISHCLERRKHGQSLQPLPSPFLEELPAGLLQDADDAKQGKSEEDLNRELREKLRTMFGGAKAG